MNEEVYKQGAALIAKGVPVIAVWGVMEDGSCSCPRGAECGAAGKHPVGMGWQNSAITTEEQLYEEIADVREPRNIGIPLGPKSGIIDIEHDTDAGRATAERLGLPSLGTASFTSSRSRHYLFRYNERLPQKAVMPDVNGLEVRIGADGRGAHSVAPGSRHKTGFQYDWVPGASIHECDVLDLPEPLMTLLLNHASSVQSTAANLITIDGKLSEGGRHDSVRRLSYHFAAMCRGENSPTNQQTAYAAISAINETKCQPPLDDAEVRTLVSSAFSAYRRYTDEDPSLTVEDGGSRFIERWHAVEAGADIQTVSNTNHENNILTCGLRQVGEGRFTAGDWELEMTEEQPRTYFLIIPYRKTYADGRTVDATARVRLLASDINRPDVVATKILDATGSLDVNPVPGFFASLWGGRSGGRSNESQTGIKSELLALAKTITPEAGTLPWVLYARAFVGCLRNPDKDTMTCSRPDDDGSPTWVDGHGLAFVWSQVLEEAQNICKTASEETQRAFRSAILERFGRGFISEVRFRDSRGKQRRFQVITESNLDELADYVDGLS